MALPSHSILKNAKRLVPTFLKLLLTILPAFFAGNLFAQDIIYTVKGSPIKCVVKEIGEDSVFYDLAEAASRRSLVRTDIFRIKYANGIEDTITRVRASAKNATAVKTITGTPTVTGGDIITTTDGKQLACKIDVIDEDIISYMLTGSTTISKINTKDIAFIKLSNGSIETYNATGKVPAAQEKDTMALVLLNWRRKYIAPPLELF